MAESAVKSTAEFLGKILIEEGKYLWGAQGKVEELRDELLWMQSFLREADSLQFSDESVRMWVSQIKDHVSEAEDIIDDFVIKVTSRRRVIGLLNNVKRYSLIWRELYHLHQAASSIDSLKVKISTLSPKLEKYGLKRYLGISMTDKAQEALVEQVQQGLKYAHLEDKKIVGFERNAKEVINALKSTTFNKGFHSIYGMGGLGKTTLATKISRDDGIKQHFSGGRAFVYISKQFQRRSVLQDVLNQLDSSSSNNDLDSLLHEVLRKNKCLVVLDDIWTQQDWDILKLAFTTCGGDSGSKVLITTRNEEVAKYVDPMALHKPDPLNEEESWELLQKMMGRDLQDSSRYDKKTVGSKENSEKIKLGKEMLKVCNGLPLAIVALGGILRKKQSVGDWHSVHKNINSYLRMGYDHGRSCMDILLQSCNDLPFHLKPCFLHLAHFPEDYGIHTQNLYWMWVAEGLVTRSSCTDRTSSSNKSLEEVANDYMNELALVGLVEIIEKTSEGWIEIIRMHDLVREVCLEKATTEDFLKTVDLRPGQDNQQLSTADYYSSKRLFRLSIHLPSPGNSSIVNNSAITDSLSSRGYKYLRSLLFTIPDTYGDNEDQTQQLMESICNEVQMLRVLVLDRMSLKGRLTTQVGNLLHLRYLSLAGTRVCELPSSIGKLRFLEILNLQVNKDKLIIPNTLWKLFRLRHLLLPRTGYEIKKLRWSRRLGSRTNKTRAHEMSWNLDFIEEPTEKMRVDTLIWLETIENMRVGNHRTKDLLKIKNLTRLSIQGSELLTEEEMLHIIAALKSSVGTCSGIKVRGDVISKNPTILSGFVCNHKLKIIGWISVHLTENVDYFSQFLVELNLEECELEDDPMRILGSLCHLRVLCLDKNSYVGTKLSCHSNSFPLLIGLHFRKLEKLEVFEVEHGSMPKLERLWIKGCTQLNEISDVLPSSLKCIDLYGTGKKTQGIFDYSTCRLPQGGYYEGGVHIVNPQDFHRWLENAVLLEVENYKKVILLGESCFGKAYLAMKNAYRDGPMKRTFEAVARTYVPKRRKMSDNLISRHILKQLLRDLKQVQPDEDYEDPTTTSREKLMTEIQQLMQQRKCLIILKGVDLHHLHCLDELDRTFGLIGCGESFQSKLVITTSISDNDQVSAATIVDHCNRLKVFKLRGPTPVETWEMLDDQYRGYWNTNAGIKWNMMRHCSSHPLLTLLVARFLDMKENLVEWATEHSLEKQLIVSNPHKIFAMCYNDLPLHLRSCLIFLASFPEDVEIPKERLFQLWIAAGFVRSKHVHDEVVQTGEHLENLASTYLTELEQRGMVTIFEEACRLKFGLRDMCLEKAKEEHILTIVDLIEYTTSTSNTKLKTQQLAVYLDQISSSSTPTGLEHEKLGFISSPTSLLIFPTINDPLYNEEKWEWLLYICKHFQLLRVLDLEGFWMTKGSLPKEVGNMTQLRYLSLKGTWVSELPPSIRNLINLQTLDLRVLESIILPDVLWKLSSLMHLYLPRKFNTQKTVAKLQLLGLNCLQTLVNLSADKVCWTDLLELKLLRKLSIIKDDDYEVEEMYNILRRLSRSLKATINGTSIWSYITLPSSPPELGHRIQVLALVDYDQVEEVVAHSGTRCFDLSSFKKGFPCW